MTNAIEHEGIGYCMATASHNNWLFRHQPDNDIGIDAHMEFVDSSGKPKQLLALQIKSGPSWFKEEKDEHIVFRDINQRQYNYWTTNSLPCIIVLYNPEDKKCIWQKLTLETIEKTKGGKGKGYFVKVPKNRVFIDSVSNIKLLSFTNLPEHIVNYNFLLSQKEFMQIIQDGGIVKLHSSEWVNKSSGRGDTELIVDDGECIKKYSYPYWFPFTPYTEVFPRLFPWADFSADEEFYENNDEAVWREYNCYYDKEAREWLIVGDTFDEFRKKLDPIRSINYSGEVAEYMLVLSLNDLGRAFLKVNEFVSKNQIYATTRPQEDEDNAYESD